MASPTSTQPAIEPETAEQSETESTENQTENTVIEDPATSDEGNKGQIIAVLYLSPQDKTDPWEFKSIAIEGQETHAAVFNLRRLFPLTAESYMRLRVGEGNAVAVSSSEMACTILYHMLRLAMYLEGVQQTDLLADQIGNVSVESDIGFMNS